MVQDRIIDLALHQPAAIAVADGDRQLDYAGLLAEAAAVCCRVADRPGRRGAVGVLRRHDVGALTAVVGVLASGFPLVVLDPTVPLPRLHRYVELAGVDCVLTDSGTVGLAEELADQVIDTDALRVDVARLGSLEAAVNILRAARPAPSDPALLVYTSGSTGAPKGVVCDHRSVLHDAWTNSVGTGCYGPGDGVAHLLPMAFSAGIGLSLATLLCGARQHLFDPRGRSVAELPAWLSAEGIDVLVASPAILRGLVTNRPAGQSLTGLRAVTMAGETVFGQELERLRVLVGPGCELRNRYGSTETWLVAENVFTSSTSGVDGAAPVGRAVPGVTLEVQDQSGVRSSTGTGRVVVTSHWLSSGYRHDPVQSAGAFTVNDDGSRSFLTSDVGRLDGGVLTLLGRADHSVKIRGFLVEPGEIDAVLYGVSEVREAVVTGVVSPATQRPRLVAYVVSTDPRPQAARIRAAVRSALPDYMVPEQVVFLNRLPRNERGKLDRSALPVPPELELGAGVAHSDWEVNVLAVFRRVLGLDGLGADDEFFAVGGDSLAAEELLAAMHAELGVANGVLSTATLAQAPTPRAFAAAVRTHRVVPTGAILLRPGTGPTPLFLIAGAGGIAIGFRTLATHLDPDLPVYGLQSHGMENRGLPDWSVRRMARRHLRAIRRVQPHGPYRIGGHSMGGLVALEVASQLLADGEIVELLAVLDSFPPDRSLMPAVVTGPPLVRLRRMAAVVGAGLLPDGEIGPYSRFHSQGRALARRYRTRAYPGRTLVVVAQDDVDAVARRQWERHLTGRWDLRMLPGNHESILREPRVAAVARAVDDALAQRAGSITGG